jgi:16S rRNA (guanine527-N7)-methyltransferase
MVSADQFKSLLLHHLGGHFRLNEYHLERLEEYFLLLQKWNKKINLTSIEKVEEIIIRHFCESIALANTLPFAKLRVMDVGSGAGFPGIPLAIVRPDCFIYLVEVDARKAVFLKEASLRLMNVIVLKQRIQTVEQQTEWIVCRGVNWVEIKDEVSRLAEHVALMIGEDSVSTISSTEFVEWEPPTRSPWGDHRVILVGHMPGVASVPRGTS